MTGGLFVLCLAFMLLRLSAFDLVQALRGTDLRDDATILIVDWYGAGRTNVGRLTVTGGWWSAGAHWPAWLPKPAGW